jgi:hypothetical protein
MGEDVMSVSGTWKSSWVAVVIVVSLVAGSFVILAEASSGAFGSPTNSQSALGRRLAIEGLHGPVDVGAPLGFQLAVLDNKGDIVRSYKGTVEFSSSDPEAVVPSSYTFVRSDSGQHVFPVGSLVFNSLGNQTFTAFDVKTTKLSGTIEVYVEKSNTPPSGDWSTPVSIAIGSNSEMYREVTIDSDSLGFTAVAWSGSYGNGGWGVFANMYEPGVGWLGAKYLGPVAQFPGFVCVGVDESSNVTVAWINDQDVCSVRYTSAAKQWEPTVVVSSGANTPRQLTMAVESYGRAVLAWQEGEGAGIYASTRQAGNIWSASELIESRTGYAGYPSAAITDGGDAFVAIQVDNGSYVDVCVNRYLAIPGYWLGETNIEDLDWYSQFPQVSMDLYGNAFVVWDYCNGYVYTPYVNVFQKGFGWSGPKMLDSGTSTMMTYPVASTYGNFNAVVSWTISSSDGMRDIRTNRFVNGSSWTGPVTVASGMGNSFVTSVSADSSGDSYLAWFQGDFSGNSSGGRVIACVYNDSSGWSSPSIVGLVSNTTGLAVAAGPAETAIMVWNEFGSNNDVWASDFAVRA